MTTERGEEWDAVRREVLGGTEGCARGEATKRLGSSREISHKYDDARRRGDEGERRCYAPWTVIVPDNMTPSGGPRSSEGEMRDEPGARVRLRRPRGSRPAVGRVGARRVEIFFLVGRIEPFVHELISPHHMVHSPATRPFV